jgi:hypothetical protein
VSSFRLRVIACLRVVVALAPLVAAAIVEWAGRRWP